MIEDKSKIQKRVQKYSYFLNDILGEGYSSSVYKGINFITNQVVAIKVINFSTLTTPISQTLLKNEIAILKQLDHENLMKVYEIFETKNNTYIICEYCNDGDLANILEKSNFTQAEIMNIFVQIAKGVKALHDQKIIHRDIKPANILRSNGIYKLSDFGFAIVENDFESIIKRFSVGTPVYMAPETVQSNSYSEKSDIWSLGVVLYLMVYKEIPYNLKKDGDLNGKQQQIHAKIMNDKSLTKKIQNVLVGMLELDQQKRMNIDRILSILNEQKKLKCYNSHQNIPFKVLRRATGYDSNLLDGSNNDSYGNSQKVLKTQPDELENIDEKTEPISFCNHHKQHTFEVNNPQQNKPSNNDGQETKFDSSPIITKEKQKKQIRINIPTIQSNYIIKLNSNQNQLPSEHSDMVRCGKISFFQQICFKTNTNFKFKLKISIQLCVIYPYQILLINIKQNDGQQLINLKMEEIILNLCRRIVKLEEEKQMLINELRNAQSSSTNKNFYPTPNFQKMQESKNLKKQDKEIDDIIEEIVIDFSNPQRELEYQVKESENRNELEAPVIKKPQGNQCNQCDRLFQTSRGLSRHLIFAHQKKGFQKKRKIRKALKEKKKRGIKRSNKQTTLETQQKPK